MISAEIIQDSINPVGDRLTTFVINFPRIILAELNTHRALSKNSSSSRAIKFETMLELVKTNPFIPTRFQKDHKGMQGNEYFEGGEHFACVRDWLAARDSAVKAATNFRHPVTKQIRNRLLEPFMWQKVVLSGTDFENLFALRAHEDAEIHFQELAYKALEEYNKSEPKLLKEGEWHIPFGDNMDEGKINRLIVDCDVGFYASKEQIQEAKIKIAIARCARVSYLNFEGNDDYAADIKLCDRLFKSNPKHLSPTEHVAQALSNSERFGNFQGFKQYRYFIPDQNLKDPRVIKKGK